MLQKISFSILAVALASSLLYWGFMILALPVVFFMSFDNTEPTLENFVMHLAGAIVFFIVSKGKIISVLIALVAAFFYWRKNYKVSIFVSILVFCSMYGIHQYHALKQQAQTEAYINQMKIDSEKERTTEPSAPYFVTKKNFSFLDYGLESRRVTDSVVQYSYRNYNDVSTTRSWLLSTQKLVSNDSQYYKEKPTQVKARGKLIDVFEYDGFYGYTYKHPKDQTSSFFGEYNDIGEESYSLYWANSEVVFELVLTGFPETESETKVSQYLKEALLQYEKAE